MRSRTRKRLQLAAWCAVLCAAALALVCLAGEAYEAAAWPAGESPEVLHRVYLARLVGGGW